MYASGLQYLDKLQDAQMGELAGIMSDKTSSGTYWYWDKSADDAIYAQLLIER
jgi:hypothetical protein